MEHNIIKFNEQTDTDTHTQTHTQTQTQTNTGSEKPLNGKYKIIWSEGVIEMPGRCKIVSSRYQKGSRRCLVVP